MSFFVERNIRTERLEITMITVNAMGDTCPIPVVKTKNAIKELNGAGVVETLVDNEIAVQNLTKMANQKGYGVKSEKISDGQYKVTMEIGKEAAAGTQHCRQTMRQRQKKKKTVLQMRSMETRLL